MKTFKGTEIDFSSSPLHQMNVMTLKTFAVCNMDNELKFSLSGYVLKVHPFVKFQQ